MAEAVGRRGDGDSEAAPAKLNLFLHVHRRRPDGRHDLSSLAVFPDFGDRVTLVPGRTFAVRYDGPTAPAVRAGLPAGSDDLVTRAARAMADLCGRSCDFALHVDKQIPVAAGLGGGSADAAAAMRLLARHWRVAPPADELADVALSLGADVPVCLASRPSLMAGLGERLRPARLTRPFAVLLCNPGLPVRTADVFARCTPSGAAPEGSGSGTPVAGGCRDGEPVIALEHLRDARNDLQAPACALAPGLEALLSRLAAHGEALLSRMSGSGATCFALAEDAAAARRIERDVAEPGLWTRVCALPAGAGAA